MSDTLPDPAEILANPSRDADGDGPFSASRLSRIFAATERFPDRAKARETSHLEFKQAFSVGSSGKYAKTMAAFANADGGYIVFGISNSPHKFEGLKDGRFNEFDSAIMTNFLNDHLAPEIRWEKYLHSINNKDFGLIYVFSSREKPVICTKNSSQDKEDKPSLKEGEIYYRYRGRSECIKYPELRGLIEAHRKQEQTLWMKHLKKIARIGVKNAGIFDVNSGHVSGAGGTFIIDERLLPKLAFIREGEFVEHDGSPALRLIGSVSAIQSSILPSFRKVVETRSIHGSDLINAFLANDQPIEPNTYMLQICYETSSYFPIYCFLRQAKLSIVAAIQLINGVITTQPTKHRLIARLSNDKSLSLPIPGGESSSAKQKRAYVSTLNSATLLASQIPDDSVKYALQSVRMLDRRTLNAVYLRAFLKDLYDKYYGKPKARSTKGVDDEIRRAICFLDAALNRDAILNSK